MTETVHELETELADGPQHRRRTDQPKPSSTSEICVQDEVISYIETSKRTGIEKYGSVLRPHNGRDALRDAFEEAVDLTQYLAQALIERDGRLPDSITPPSVQSLRSRCATGAIGYSIEWFPADPDDELPERSALTLFDRGASAQRVLWETTGANVEELAVEAVAWLKTQRTESPTTVDG